jgi:hypothetical protein
MAWGALGIVLAGAFVVWAIRARDGATVVTGWEVIPRFWEQDMRRDRYDPSWLRYRDLILDRLVNELGINRIEIKSGAENPSHSDKALTSNKKAPFSNNSRRQSSYDWKQGST